MAGWSVSAAEEEPGRWGQGGLRSTVGWWSTVFFLPKSTQDLGNYHYQSSQSSKKSLFTKHNGIISRVWTPSIWVYNSIYESRPNIVLYKWLNHVEPCNFMYRIHVWCMLKPVIFCWASDVWNLGMTAPAASILRPSWELWKLWEAKPGHEAPGNRTWASSRLTRYVTTLREWNQTHTHTNTQTRGNSMGFFGGKPFGDAFL